MTPLEPGYGETALDWDELAALLPDARDVLPDPPTKADVYDLEQAVQTAVTEDLVGAVLDGAVGLEDIVTDRFLRAMHARIHPFADGNGRSTRLLADLTFLAAQGADDPPATYDWDVDKRAYIEALRRYDRHRDPTELAALVTSRLIGG